MKKVIRFLIISLAPIAFQSASAALYSLIYANATIYFQTLPTMICFLLSGVLLFIIYITVIKHLNPARIPYEILVGIILCLLFPFFYNSPLIYPSKFSLALDYCNMSALIGAGYGGFFGASCRQVMKLKKQKIEQDNQQSQE